MTRYEDLPQADFDTETSRCPMAMIADRQRSSPVMRLTSDNPDRNVLLVTGSSQVLDVIGDADTFSSQGHPQAKRFDSDFDPQAAAIFAERGQDLKNIMVWSDGAYHARIRKLVQRAFSPPEVRKKEPYLRIMIDALIDDFAQGGTVDFGDAFAWRLPTRVITREFGLPDDLVPLIHDVTNKVSMMLDPLGPPDASITAASAISDLHDVLMAQLADIDKIPDNTLLKQLGLVQGEGEGALASDELRWLATILLVAGGHTTTAMLGWTLYMLALHPDIQDRLRADPSGIELFVEEVLRLHGPVPTSYRTATRDTCIGDVAVPAGSWVLVRWDAINLDPARWDDPERFDPERDNVKKHSTFGHGKHFCIGNVLGRAELRLTVEAMLTRFSSIRLGAPLDNIVPIPTFDVHMLQNLPLMLLPAQGT
jgi:cytochrome P450